ncbi:MAG: SGNH/GDSL hydrolase family protein [Spirochaetales bacterium]|nr:SGNH/GDSL hydrolase family protein [Spirochaetales bacterium]
MRKEILFLGDSLTAGTIGSSYFKLLTQNKILEEYSLINLGENGFTIAGLRVKLEHYLQSNKAPSILVIEGGANDLLLPHMQNQGLHWDPFIRKLRRHGSVPAASVSAFRTQLNLLLGSAMDGGIPVVLLCTIPFLGEDLTSGLNRKREAYNAVIRTACRESDSALFKCVIADLAAGAEKILSENVLEQKSDSDSCGPEAPGSWLFKAPADFERDALRIRETGEETLCRERGLRLSIDGAHPNRQGAALMASVLLKTLRENSLLF